MKKIFIAVTAAALLTACGTEINMQDSAVQVSAPTAAEPSIRETEEVLRTFDISGNSPECCGSAENENGEITGTESISGINENNDVDETVPEVFFVGCCGAEDDSEEIYDDEDDDYVFSEIPEADENIYEFEFPSGCCG